MYSFALRRMPARQRRAVEPMTDLVADVMRADTRLVEEHLTPCFRNVADHRYLKHRGRLRAVMSPA
jgi:magnesium transporter